MGVMEKLPRYMPKASACKVIKADGSVEVVPAHLPQGNRMMAPGGQTAFPKYSYRHAVYGGHGKGGPALPSGTQWVTPKATSTGLPVDGRPQGDQP